MTSVRQLMRHRFALLLSVAAAAGVAGVLAVPRASDAATALPSCHPDLFTSAHQVVATLNQAAETQLQTLKQLIADHPKLQAGSTKTWQSTLTGGVINKVTLSANADGSYSYERDLAAPATPALFQRIVTMDLASTTANTVTDTSGVLSIDYAAWHAVVASEPLTGEVSVSFVVDKDTSKPAPGTRKTLSIGFTTLSGGGVTAGGPYTGSYVHLGEPGLGGDLTFQAAEVLNCPSNSRGLVSDVIVESRWYKTATGAIHGRTDAEASGGIVASGEHWVATSCNSGANAAYFLAKLEDARGNTVPGSAAGGVVQTPAACDPVFGAVPLVLTNANDRVFGKPLTFPGEW